MKFSDLLHMSVTNLIRRKGRTMLTVLGVVIGCCAIVIMISLGIGMQLSQEEMLASMGNLKQITVSPSYRSDAKKPKLDKVAVAEMEKIPGVESVVAKKSMDLGDLMMTAGDEHRYMSYWTTVVGISLEDYEESGYVLDEGSWSGKSGTVLFGKYTAFNFIDTKRSDENNMVNYWDDVNAQPFFKVLSTPFTISQQKDNSTYSEDGTLTSSSITWTDVLKLTASGILAEDYEKGEETEYGILMNMKDFERLQKKVAQITNTKFSTEYSTVIITTSSIDNVGEIEEQIESLGYNTYSMESIRKPMRESTQQKQMMLAAIGAVSLLVAAIGIANTMIMSITERTREIGIMKALGCSPSNIRREFLTESAVIGFLGGVVGVGFSYLISFLMNNFSGLSLTSDSIYSYYGDASSTALSVIPLWLVAGAILFSMLMGVAAGFIPANRAVRISALEAMKI